MEQVVQGLIVVHGLIIVQGGIIEQGGMIIVQGLIIVQGGGVSEWWCIHVDWMPDQKAAGSNPSSGNTGSEVERTLSQVRGLAGGVLPTLNHNRPH